MTGHPMVRGLPTRSLRIQTSLVLMLCLVTPLSIVLAEASLFLALVLWIVRRIRGEAIQRFWDPLVTPAVVFGLVAVVASLFGTRPLDSMSSFHRLIMPLGLLPIADSVRSAPRPRRILMEMVMGWVAGTCVLAVHDMIRVPLHVRSGGNLYDAGNMRDPQFYLITLAVLAAWPWSRAAASGWWPRAAGMALAAVGMVLHFKRGTMLAFGTVLLGLSILQRRRILVAVLLAGALGLGMLPAVRARFAALRKEGGVEFGGRLVLWTEVAPPAIRAHPFGFGYRVVRYEDLRMWSTRFQPGLNHLHNNVLQVTLETGWIGLGAWLTWMGMVGVQMIRNVRATRDGPVDLHAMAWGVGAAFAGLHLNGMIEYNAGDTEILIALVILTGWTAALRRPVSSPDRTTAG